MKTFFGIFLVVSFFQFIFAQQNYNKHAKSQDTQSTNSVILPSQPLIRLDGKANIPAVEKKIVYIHPEQVPQENMVILEPVELAPATSSSYPSSKKIEHSNADIVRTIELPAQPLQPQQKVKDNK